MARFVERSGKVYIETDSGLPLAYFDTDGTLVPLYGVAHADAQGKPVSGTKPVTTLYPPNPNVGSGKKN